MSKIFSGLLFAGLFFVAPIGMIISWFSYFDKQPNLNSMFVYGLLSPFIIGMAVIMLLIGGLMVGLAVTGNEGKSAEPVEDSYYDYAATDKKRKNDDAL